MHAAHQLAMASDHIRADMVDASEFSTLSQKYNVSGVPKTIINGSQFIEGTQPIDRLFLEILKVVHPEEFEKLKSEVRAARGGRRVRNPNPEHIYEVAIVGGGPAAMSAGVYAARKELDTLMIAQEIGGQVNYTASIDNYLGLPGIGGKELTEMFREHVERYPIAQALGDEVVSIRRDEEHYVVTLKKGVGYRAHSVIYCSGKEYRRLGIPREEQFIGRGIAFCATCDAPLYKDRRVAVVGGGNSAFTAARDLVNFASEIYLIHRRDEFTADPALIRQVSKAGNVKILTNRVVRDILGQEKFEGIRIRPSGDGPGEDLKVDGMFLEIGLIPNSDPVREMVQLNEKGEVRINHRNETNLPGFFAAGDVTDVFEKQICIAVGDGAKAALAAHEYLLEHQLTQSKVKVGDAWE